MSTTTDSSAAPAAKKSSRGAKVLYAVVALVFAAAGAVVPMVLDVKSLMGKSTAHDEPAAKTAKEAKTVSIPFGDAVVNLADERMQRYLRIKIVLVVDQEHEKDATERVAARKAEMKSWLISHLCGKTLKDVTGTVGVNRTQREIFERFEDILYASGHGHLKNVLFEEYVVQ